MHVCSTLCLLLTCHAGIEILEQLGQFRDNNSDLHDLCLRAHAFRRSQCLAFIDKKLRVTLGSDTNLDNNDFAEVRHYIGRLGSHVSAARILVDSARQLPSLFDDFEIAVVRGQASPPGPTPLGHKVTFDGIVNRMGSADDKELSELRAALEHMNSTHDLGARFCAGYESKNFQPRVHAELILLEYFYSHRLEFMDGDRYIGCSKPACYCCWLYIRAHPGRFAEPACHNKIWLNWSPPGILTAQSSIDGLESKHTSNIINEMVKTVRSDTKEQVLNRSTRRSWHPDSTTGITYSVEAEIRDTYSNSGVDSDDSDSHSMFTSILQRRLHDQELYV